MARTFPVLYATTAQVGSSSQRALSATSPGSTDNTATTNTSFGALANWRRIVPYADSSADYASAPPSGQVGGVGWCIDIVAALGDGVGTVTLAAGTWTLPFHYSRPGGLLTGDVTIDQLTLILSRVNPLPNADSANEASLQEIGRATVGPFTVTTSEQVTTVNVTGAQAVFNAGDYLWVETYFDPALHLALSDTVRWHTNSTTGLRITAAPAYTIQYRRSHAHTATPAQTQYRKSTYRRRHDESLPLTQAQIRRAHFPRSHAETVPAPAAAQSRRIVTHRAHAEAAPVSDVQYRRVESNRRHTEAVPTPTLAHYRRLELHRRHADSVPAPLDTQIRRLIARRRHEEAVPMPADTQTRSIVTHRHHSEDVNVAQTQLRKVTYRRRHDEQLSEGGGSVVRKRILIVDDT